MWPDYIDVCHSRMTARLTRGFPRTGLSKLKPKRNPAPAMLSEVVRDATRWHSGDAIANGLTTKQAARANATLVQAVERLRPDYPSWATRRVLIE